MSNSEKICEILIENQQRKFNIDQLMMDLIPPDYSIFRLRLDVWRGYECASFVGSDEVGAKWELFYYTTDEYNDWAIKLLRLKNHSVIRAKFLIEYFTQRNGNLPFDFNNPFSVSRLQG